MDSEGFAANGPTMHLEQSAPCTMVIRLVTERFPVQGTEDVYLFSNVRRHSGDFT